MIDANGYVSYYNPKHHRTSSNGMLYEHIRVAEEKLGRELNDDEVVHHINEIKSDNKKENLLIFATRGDHTAYHNGCEYWTDENGVSHAIALNRNNKRNRKNKINRNNKSNKCCICGKNIAPPATQCADCIRKERSLNSMKELKEKVSREKLKFEIKNFPMTEVGRIHNVTDNTIRKWCKKYKLPFRSKDIYEISDEDWKTV